MDRHSLSEVRHLGLQDILPTVDIYFMKFWQH